MINIDFYTDYEDCLNIKKYNKFLEEYKEYSSKISDNLYEVAKSVLDSQN